MCQLEPYNSKVSLIKFTVKITHIICLIIDQTFANLDV